MSAAARALTLTVLVFGLTAAPAAAQGILFFEEPVRVLERVRGSFAIGGQITVAFRGEGVDGTIVHRPAPEGSVFLATYATRSGRLRDVSLFGEAHPAATTAARVVRTRPDGTRRVCTDAQAMRFGGVTSGPARVYRLALPGRGGLRTRCGGPTDGELAALLPQATVPARDAILDLGGERTFAIGGMTGTVRSTLVVRLDGLRRERVARPRSRPPGGPPTRRIAWDVERVEGSVTADSAVPADSPDCEPLGLCGFAGTHELALAGATGRGGISLRGRSGGGFVELAGGRLRTTARAPATACADEGEAPLLGIDLQMRRDRVEAALVPRQPDVFGATRCAAPAAADIGLTRRLATGTFSRSALAGDRVTLRLRGREAGGTPVARGRTRGEVVVVLRRRAA